MKKFLIFLWAFLRPTPAEVDLSTVVKERKPRRKTKAKHRQRLSKIPIEGHRGLLRRVVRNHTRGLTNPSPKVHERRRTLTYFMHEIFCAGRRGWQMKNKIRKKIGKAPLRWASVWKKGRDFTPPFVCEPTRAQVTAAGREYKAYKRRLERARKKRESVLLLGNKSFLFIPKQIEFLPEGVGA